MSEVERPLPPSSDGSVVLDIGGEIGALVLRTSAALDRAEIDLHPDAADQPNTHSAVRERKLPGGSAYAAVYPILQEGTYTVVGSTQRLTISGGQVLEVDLDPGYPTVGSGLHDHPAESHLHHHGEHTHAHR